MDHLWLSPGYRASIVTRKGRRQWQMTCLLRGVSVTGEWGPGGPRPQVKVELIHSESLSA